MHSILNGVYLKKKRRRVIDLNQMFKLNVINGDKLFINLFILIFP